MTTVFKNAMVYESGEMKKQTMLFDGAALSVFTGDIFPVDAKVIDNIIINVVIKNFVVFFNNILPLYIKVIPTILYN